MPPKTLAARLAAAQAPAKPQNLNAADVKPAGMSLRTLVTTLGRAKATGDRALYAALVEGADPSTLFAALSDVLHDGAGAVGDVIGQPQYLGELWSGRPFTRRIIPLLGSAALTALKIQGWRWVVEPEVGPWAGNKAAVPSNLPATEQVEVLAKRLAGVHDVAREFRDFPNPEFWDGYFRGMTQSYDRQADDGTLGDLLRQSSRVERQGVPAGVSPGMVSIIDGALGILDRGIPSFAVVAKDLYRDIVLTRSEDSLAYLNAALGLEEGTIDTFKVVPHPKMFAGTALVGAKEAATSYELGGVPIRVEGLDMVRGGIDPGVFGYYGTVVHDEAALALTGTAAALAAADDAIELEDA